MADILDELKQIRDAELKAREIIANANKKAEALVSDAEKEGSEIRTRVSEKKESIEKDMDINYSRTYSLMLAKLDRDYSKRTKTIEDLDTKPIARTLSNALFVILKNYGKNTATS